MALMLSFPSSKTLSLNTLLPSHQYSKRSSQVHRHVVLGSSMPLAQTCDQQTVIRKTANYQPPIWNHELLLSLKSEYKGPVYEKRSAQLKEKVRVILENTKEPLERLEFIDTMERLGISYHFEAEIENILKKMYTNVDHRNTWSRMKNIHAMALEFRLLRQHGYMVSQNIFAIFKDGFGNFNESFKNDIEGLVSLYEASFLLMNGEEILEEAMEFTTKHLKLHLKRNKHRVDNTYIDMLASHSLERPLHWRINRMEARWFIDVYEKKRDMNSTLLSFAKLDFNMLQAIHQEDLQRASRWWENTCWKEKLPFVRNRVVENYLWSLGEAYEPKYSVYRDLETRINITTTCLDDLYDIYGTLDELTLFTDVVERWDVNDLDKLPEYMRICFLGLFNLINELSYHTLKEHGLNVLPYLKSKWLDLLRYYMKEVKWASTGYIPTLVEYLDYAWASISTPELLTHAFFLSKKDPITKKELDGIEKYHDIIKWPSMVARLSNDLGTSSYEVVRGDVPKSIQIYMHETGASAEEARDHVKSLISEAWKKINEARFSDSPFSWDYIKIATDLARVSQFMYDHGDGHGHDMGGKNKDRIIALLVEPIPLLSKDLFH